MNNRLVKRDTGITGTATLDIGTTKHEQGCVTSYATRTHGHPKLCLEVLEFKCTYCFFLMISFNCFLFCQCVKFNFLQLPFAYGAIYHILHGKMRVLSCLCSAFFRLLELLNFTGPWCLFSFWFYALVGVPASLVNYLLFPSCCLSPSSCALKRGNGVVWEGQPE